MALLVLVDLRDLIHLLSRLVVVELLLVSVLGRAASVWLNAEQWVLLGEQAAHVDRLLVILDLVRLDARLQIYDGISSRLVIVVSLKVTIDLFASLVLRRIV